MDHQVDDAAGIAPLVVVPGDGLEEVVIELNARAGVENRASGIVNEVGGDHFLFSVAKETFERATFRRCFHSSADRLIAGGLGGFKGQVHNRHVGGGDAERHAGQLALKLRHRKGDRLGSAGGGGDDVLASAATATPVLL